MDVDPLQSARPGVGVGRPRVVVGHSGQVADQSAPSPPPQTPLPQPPSPHPPSPQPPSPQPSSSSLFYELGGIAPHTPPSRRRQRRTMHLQDDEVAAAFINPGSSEDESEMEDEVLIVHPRSRVMQFHAPVESDEEDEAHHGCMNLQWLVPRMLRPASPPPVVAAASPTDASPPPVVAAASPTAASPPPVVAAASPTAASPPPVIAASPSPAPLAMCYKPYDQYDFEWRSFPASPVPPSERRETFSIQSGPTGTYAGPYEAFTAIWDLPIIERIARETNTYAEQHVEQLWAAGELGPHSRITRWVDTDSNELMRFFAIMLATGVTIKNRLEDYWNSKQNIFATPGFAVEMSYNRFLLLSRCLHFNDNSTLSPGASYTEVKLHKLQPVLDHLNAKFQSLYVLGQNVALDESLTMWKGLLDINQFLGKKAAGVGIKTYEICESQTGYLWKFKVHTTNEPQPITVAGPVSGAIASLVLSLTDDLKYSGRTLWMDNYYNSPALARTLKTFGLDCVGTLRVTRQLVPVELTELRKGRMVKGDVYGCTSGDVDLMAWRDNSLVVLISTYHGATMTEVGRRRLPTVIYDYNLCMGGVDKKDQMLAMYPLERRRTKVWYKKFFRRLLNVSVLNSYILYTHQRSEHRNMTHREYRTELILQMLALHQPRHVRTPVFIPNHMASEPITAVQHTLRQLPGQRRRLCVRCRKRSYWECVECSKGFCRECHIIVHMMAT